MAKKRGWPWVVGAVVVLALSAAGALAVVRDPLLLPGDHEVAVYGLDEQVTTEVDQRPGLLGRALGMCDADSYYVEHDGKKMCLVLNGPLGDVHAHRKNGTVTVSASDVSKLKGVDLQGATTLVLMAGKPAALVPITQMQEGQTLTVPAL
ncbi:hypothetical protein [Paractinoplanes durhamensis]|uniref:Uncharacterized protein n=1 Tax=Paractinoplanes durhamensis TaxID=113563 RepID=A0ABQ3ZC67_9ACTN|nr:hypothetical protein [Actinoplanes durhamensis]GIE07410.1 hypothetical protein Adu01nite_87600 [Actinoplanes durhamensis]